MPASNSILIVDDNSSVRRAMRYQMEASGFDVCGEAFDGRDAVEKAPALRPGLIILDLSMPRMNGIDAARELNRLCPDSKILLFTLHAQIVGADSELPNGVDLLVGKNENLLNIVLGLLKPRRDN